MSKVRLPVTASFFIFFPPFSHHNFQLEARCSEHDEFINTVAEFINTVAEFINTVAEFINTALESLSSSSPFLNSIAIHITK